MTVTADTPASGMAFDKWVVKTGSTAVTFADEFDTTTTFTMPEGNVSVEATYKIPAKTITVTKGQANVAEAPSGITVNLTADVPASGMAFDKWIVHSGGVTVANENSEITSFVMGGEDVSVEATYKAIPHTVYVTDGKANGSATLTATPGTSVTVVADTKSGYKFDYWYVEGVTLSSKTSSTATFTMPANNVTLMACYMEED